MDICMSYLSHTHTHTPGHKHHHKVVFVEESGHMIPDLHMSASGYHGIAHIEIESEGSGKSEQEPLLGK
ncbi:hypothetical protein EON63_21860 [archaeon]|nr:MAG: hypothetical protein EON63_21860 [archaeon]